MARLLGLLCVVIASTGCSRANPSFDTESDPLGSTSKDEAGDVGQTSQGPVTSGSMEGDGDGTTSAATSVGSDGQTAPPPPGTTTDDPVDPTTGNDTNPGAECGNGVLDDNEECDGDNLGDGSCMAFGFQEGTVFCTKSCHFDDFYCHTCGNGVVEAEEECDLDDIPISCNDLGLGDGTPMCSPECLIDEMTCGLEPPDPPGGSTGPA